MSCCECVRSTLHPVPHLPLLLTYKRAAEELGVTTETVRHLANAGRLERRYVTRQNPRIPQASLLAFIDSLGEQALSGKEDVEA